MSMVSTPARPVFDLSGIDFVAVGDMDVPAFEPSPEDDAWRLGYELELAGEPAMLRDRGYSPEQQLRFALGQRAARDAAADFSPMGENTVVRPTPEALAAMLRDAASHCGMQGGMLGDFLAGLIRDAAFDVEYYRAASWQEFSAREAEMIETLQDCPTCKRNAWLERM